MGPTEDSKEVLTNGIKKSRPKSSSDLCEKCQSLNLQPERFVVSNEDPRPSSGTKLVVRSNTGDFRGAKVRLETLQNLIHKRDSCALCDLLVSTTGSFILDSGDVQNHEFEKIYVSLKWEIDGRRQSEGRLISSTRRIHVTWSNDDIPDAYLTLLAPASYWRANSDVEGNWGPAALFLGRRIDGAKSNEFLMTSWLKSCIDNHNGNCCQTTSSSEDMSEIANSSWFSVIDVLHKHLKPLPTYKYQAKHYRRQNHVREKYKESFKLARHEPFVALSYVWGSEPELSGARHQPHYMTTRDNVLFHSTPGGLEDRWNFLPKTIQDAIKLTAALGYRYLWVDALCIVQDSGSSWKWNASVMDKIYASADFTICAADGNSNREGLKAWHLTNRQEKKQSIRKCGDVMLMATQLAEDIIQQSSWNSRAWTFQERMLSRRCLVFCEGRVFFQCRTAVMSEDIVAEPRGAGWSLELSRAPHQILHDLQVRPITVYMKCVSLYSARRLTRSGDVMAAFGGISNVLKCALRGDLVFGLPTSHFDLALLWQPTGKVKRRGLQSDDGLSATSWTGLEFPSWSWCGWQADGNSVMEYNTSVLEGCLINVQEFLLQRTWIEYYIRDDRGELRPIMDDEDEDDHSRERRADDRPEHTEKRWRGYKSHDPDQERTEDIYHERERHRYERERAYYDDEPAPEHSYGHEKPPFRMIDTAQGFQTEDNTDRHAGPLPRRVEIIEEWSSESSDEGSRRRRTDRYGRPRGSGKQPRKKTFSRVYADSPYRVKMAGRPHRKPSPEFPDQPILQFFTYHARLHLVQAEDDEGPANGLQRFDITDRAGDWCGSTLLDPDCDLLRRSSHMNEFEDPTYEFIALSQAKGFTSQECKSWTFFTPKTQDQSEWEVYYCLLIERRGHLWYRVALAKIFQLAFETGQWKEIIMG